MCIQRLRSRAGPQPGHPSLPLPRGLLCPFWGTGVRLSSHFPARGRQEGQWEPGSLASSFVGSLSRAQRLEPVTPSP